MAIFENKYYFDILIIKQYIIDQTSYRFYYKCIKEIYIYIYMFSKVPIQHQLYIIYKL